jgi:hypothetical protein
MQDISWKFEDILSSDTLHFRCLACGFHPARKSCCSAYEAETAFRRTAIGDRIDGVTQMNISFIYGGTFRI